HTLYIFSVAPSPPHVFCFYCSPPPPDLHSFPTRRSSDLNHERCGNASMCVGAAQGALEHAVGYLNERTVGGRPLAELQGLQWKRSEEHTSELQSPCNLVCRLLLEKKKKKHDIIPLDGRQQ